MEIITNLSSNSPGSIRAQIDAEYQKHPGLGLRQAELIAYDRVKALSEYRYQQKVNQLKLVEIRARCMVLAAIANNPIQKWWYGLWHSVSIELELERIRLELLRFEEEEVHSLPLIRDAASELRVAMDRREDILIRHPELNVSAEEFQQLFAEEIYRAKLLPTGTIKPAITLQSKNSVWNQPVLLELGGKSESPSDSSQ